MSAIGSALRQMSVNMLKIVLKTMKDLRWGQLASSIRAQCTGIGHWKAANNVPEMTQNMIIPNNALLAMRTLPRKLLMALTSRQTEILAQPLIATLKKSLA